MTLGTGVAKAGHLGKMHPSKNYKFPFLSYRLISKLKVFYKTNYYDNFFPVDTGIPEYF
jgi:hypothetical protein